jgi:hypothetical protein
LATGSKYDDVEASGGRLECDGVAEEGELFGEEDGCILVLMSGSAGRLRFSAGRLGDGMEGSIGVLVGVMMRLEG